MQCCSKIIQSQRLAQAVSAIVKIIVVLVENDDEKNDYHARP